MAAGTEGLEGIVMGPSQISMNVTDTTAWATAMNNLGIAPVGLTGPPLVSDPICVPAFEHGLGLMAGMAPVNPMMTGISLLRPAVPPGLPVMKEIIHCTSCTLFPANPNLPPPATRDRPPGCKTVFVGGLPENAAEGVIREVFEQCGDITAIRKSKKNFCHIRFAEEFMVDKAIYLSGYRMRLGSSTDKKDTGRLHVDFAQARDDFYEWECKQRMFAREERHRRMLEDEHLRPPSPAPIVHYSEHEASLMAEKLKDESKFPEAISVLLAWFERGEVTRRSANNFYSMIQSANSHSRRLMSEKAAHEQEMEDAKERFKNALARILTGFEQIVAVFKAASKQKVWDHFSKAQRKNIDIWRKQAEEIRNVHNEELMGIRREEEMEMSDDDYEESPSKLPPVDDSALAVQARALKEENDSLRWQLDAYRNEVELLKQEQGMFQRMDESHTKDQQLQFQQQAMQGMQQQLLTLQEEYRKKELELEKMKEENSHVQALLATLKEKEMNGFTLSVSTRGSQTSEGSPAARPLKSEKEALLVGIISTFLHVHPFGANIEYLWSYLQRLDAQISSAEIEMLLLQLPHMFKQEFTGVGATLEKKWKFCAFEGIKTISQ
ncbi:ecto-NOX disulfide-thiol exchanger 1 isoform X1 [Carcharodon carcharias]|uniref:ecto-NOX disulfide-thiol exchanger 1 isoform X1 n=1 Tax=Carcharodon carcharias TaxID=13397 RepID=UPI001B7F0E75|nr:ecto-NOX disulfide-thiol exchanger 1 isoform X1 [Carcharodon carcharias]XP_041067363.1 ecto-NOX disulfide-thiol exchanger 1 isoform X1 [Carcharodon carcharias]